MHSPDHSTKGTPSALTCAVQEWPLTAGEYVVSGSVSSPFRGAFHLSLTVLVHYRLLKVLSLGGWSPQLPQNPPGFGLLRLPLCVSCPPFIELSQFPLRFSTPSSPPLPPFVCPYTPE